jgi:hypothetical protein
LRAAWSSMAWIRSMGAVTDSPGGRAAGPAQAIGAERPERDWNPRAWARFMLNPGSPGSTAPSRTKARTGLQGVLHAGGAGAAG